MWISKRKNLLFEADDKKKEMSDDRHWQHCRHQHWRRCFSSGRAKVRECEQKKRRKSFLVVSALFFSLFFPFFMYRTKSINQMSPSHMWQDFHDKHKEFSTFRTSVGSVEVFSLLQFVQLLQSNLFHWLEWRCLVPSFVLEITFFLHLKFHQLNTLYSIRVHHEMLFLNRQYIVWNSQLIDNILSSFLMNRCCSTRNYKLIETLMNASRKNKNGFSNVRNAHSTSRHKTAQTMLIENNLVTENRTDE